MTDRELLERAAKSAGMKHEDSIGRMESCGGWNPLNSDADAFRLMVDCNLYNKHSLDRALGEENDICGCDYREAMRRAIVRAAAEMATN